MNKEDNFLSASDQALSGDPPIAAARWRRPMLWAQTIIFTSLAIVQGVDFFVAHKGDVLLQVAYAILLPCYLAIAFGAGRRLISRQPAMVLTREGILCPLAFRGLIRWDQIVACSRPYGGRSLRLFLRNGALAGSRRIRIMHGAVTISLDLRADFDRRQIQALCEERIAAARARAKPADLSEIARIEAAARQYEQNRISPIVIALPVAALFLAVIVFAVARPGWRELAPSGAARRAPFHVHMVKTRAVTPLDRALKVDCPPVGPATGRTARSWLDGGFRASGAASNFDWTGCFATPPIEKDLRYAPVKNFPVDSTGAMRRAVP